MPNSVPDIQFGKVPIVNWCIFKVSIWNTFPWNILYLKVFKHLPEIFLMIFYKNRTSWNYEFLIRIFEFSLEFKLNNCKSWKYFQKRNSRGLDSRVWILSNDRKISIRLIFDFDGSKNPEIRSPAVWDNIRPYVKIPLSKDFRS